MISSKIFVAFNGIARGFSSALLYVRKAGRNYSILFSKMAKIAKMILTRRQNIQKIVFYSSNCKRNVFGSFERGCPKKMNLSNF